MLQIKGGRFTRCRVNGTLRARVQVLTENPPGSGTYVPVDGALVTFQPINADAFEFHDGAGTDEVMSGPNGMVEVNVTCKQQGTCRLAVTCPGHDDVYLDVEVDITAGRSALGSADGASQQILDLRSHRGATPQVPYPVIVLVD